MSNVKNYTEQDGEKTVIGGVLEIAEGGQVIGLPSLEFQADSIATDIQSLVVDFNFLLTKLRSSGYMKSN